MEQITELSEVEWGRVDTCREGVLARSLSGRIDRAAFEAGVAACWAHLGYEPPAVVWAPGPLTALLWGATLQDTTAVDGQLYGQLYGQLGGQLGDQLRDQLAGQLYGQLGDQLYGQLRGQLYGQLRGQLYGQLGGQLYGQLGDQLDGQLGGQLYGQLGGQLYGQLYDQLRDQLRDQLYDQLRDQHSRSVSWGWRLAWIEHWLHINTIPGVQPVELETSTFARHWANALICHYWLPYKNVVIATEHPVDLHRDNQGRLHNPDGAAWLWADGTAVWALDGIRVPSWVIYQPDPTRILTELGNTEQRRVAFARYGWDRAVEHLNLSPVDVHEDPHMGVLYRLPGEVSEEPAALLVCRNASPDRDGTWRTYGLLCDPAAGSVVEAQASLARMTVDEWEQIEVAT